MHSTLSEDFGNKYDFFIFRTKSTVIPVLQVRKIEAQKLYMPDFWKSVQAKKIASYRWHLVASVLTSDLKRVFLPMWGL